MPSLQRIVINLFSENMEEDEKRTNKIYSIDEDFSHIFSHNNECLFGILGYETLKTKILNPC